MDEATWLACADPAAMLELIRVHCEGQAIVRVLRTRFSDRKLRLFACGCCRQVLDGLTDPRSRRAVEVAERLADGKAAEKEIESAIIGAFCACREVERGSTPHRFAALAHDCLIVDQPPGDHVRNVCPARVQAALLRDIFGNPWRPVRLWFGGEHSPCRNCGIYHPATRFINDSQCGGYEPSVDCSSWLSWRNGTVPKLARAIYEGRRWEDMPVLADALQEAGLSEPCKDCNGTGGYPLPSGKFSEMPGWFTCQTCWGTCLDPSGILFHCRATADMPGCGPHVRGCHVIDTLLGLE